MASAWAASLRERVCPARAAPLPIWESPFAGYAGTLEVDWLPLSRTWVVSIIFVSPIKRDQRVNVNPRAVSPLSTDAGRQARLNELVSDISARLRSACVSLSDAEFSALVRRIAETTLKYEVREEVGHG